jgi:hypothetical protein
VIVKLPRSIAIHSDVGLPSSCYTKIMLLKVVHFSGYLYKHIRDHQGAIEYKFRKVVELGKIGMSDEDLRGVTRVMDKSRFIVNVVMNFRVP